MSDGSEDNFFCEDLNTALLELLDDLVGDRGRVGAADVLGVNYRTLQHCLESRRLSRRMREALEYYRSSAPVVVDLPAAAEETGPGEEQGQSLEQRVSDLESENRALHENIEALAGQLDELRHRVATLEGRETNIDSSESLDVDQELRGEGRHYSPDHGALEAGVVTLEERPGEDQNLGVAAPRVAEWREAGRGAATANKRVERAEAEVKRLELEVSLVERFHLTLPPDREPWDEATREKQVDLRYTALQQAREESRKADLALFWRGFFTFGLWKE